jgi:hypothetical protein
VEVSGSLLIAGLEKLPAISRPHNQSAATIRRRVPSRIHPLMNSICGKSNSGAWWSNTAEEPRLQKTRVKTKTLNSAETDAITKWTAGAAVA